MTSAEKNIQDLFTAIAGMEKSQEFVIESQKITTENLSKLTDSVIALSNVDIKIRSTNKRVGDLENESNEGIKPKTLKHILVYSLALIIGFGTWATLYLFQIDKDISNHKVEYKSEITHVNTEIKEIKKKQNENKNQITYLKGSKQDKPKG